jgi:hypothetical protein
MDLFSRPPPTSLWIPEVHLKAAMLALKDAHFPGPAGRMAFRQWTFDLAARLFRAPLYRVMFFVLSPSRLIRGYEARWHTFHRGGVEARVLGATERSLCMRVTYPPHLYCEYGLMGLSTSIAAALDAAGGRSVRVEAAPISSAEAELDCRWEE